MTTRRLVEAPRFSIVTPSFRASSWLALCIASVADQEGVAVEHIVQDAGSDDGTLDWLVADARVRAFVEPDRGMYDAINRGIARARGEIVAYLNCDEQYLPGALATVARAFAERPAVDILFGGAVVVDAAGELIAQRRVVLPRAAHIEVSHLPVMSCAMFVRRRVFEERGLLFDTSYRTVSDARWVLRCLRERVAMAVLPEPLAAFVDTGANLGASPVALAEIASLRAEARRRVRWLSPLVVAHHRVRKLLAGAYTLRPIDYAIYTRTSPTTRVAFHVERPAARWR